MLLLASKNGHADVVRELLAAKAPVDVEDRRWLHGVVAGFAEWSRRRGAGIARREGRGRYQSRQWCHAAVGGGTARVCGCVQALLAAKADVNAKGADGLTALSLASGYGSVEDAAQDLLAAKADVNAKGVGGTTPLIAASRNGHADVVRALLAAGADVAAREPTTAPRHCTWLRRMVMQMRCKPCSKPRPT